MYKQIHYFFGYIILFCCTEPQLKNFTTYFQLHLNPLHTICNKAGDREQIT
jgi:hypothetical protein